MIVATAGHVDHGKTSLVRALTGVDTDRLEEERRRGMSIDLGFAYADLGGALPAGFVDVPGHERFLRNMLAGVAAIDFALLVVAADDGPMPQTMEHLAILGLLGVSRGAVALTKVDRVSPQRLEDARAEIGAALAGGPLAGAPLFPVATPSGEGVAQLRGHLAAEDRARSERPASGNFRLAIDRSFTLAGAGLVVTGAVFSGRAEVGDALLLSPGGIEVRVRAIHAQGRPAGAAGAGQRCALNLAGADLRKAEINRGDWLVAPRAHAPTDRVDVRVELLADAPGPLSHWAPVQLHLGSGACNARIALAEGRSLRPGERALAQLVTESPLCALRGDRFVIRDPAARRTLGGGLVLDPFGVQRGRGSPARLAVLRAMEREEPHESLGALLAESPEGIRFDRFERAWNLDAGEAARLAAGVPMQRFRDADGCDWALAPAAWESLRARQLEALDAHHARHPDRLGPTEVALASEAGLRRPTPASRAALRSLLAESALVRDGPSLRRPGHVPKLPPEDAALLSRVGEILAGAGLRPPIVGELAAALGTDRATLLESLDRIARTGQLVRVAPNRFFLPATVSALAETARALCEESADGSFDAAAFRDRSGIGRNLTIEVLEYLDRSGFTRFARNRRWMTGSAPPRLPAQPAGGRSGLDQ